ncbi:antibiotic biosynthesis monooxygenase (ABM) superfamily enzyme [Nocardia sp. GAS34]
MSKTEAPPSPSVHVRAAITGLAIFPMVTVGLIVMTPFSAGWPPALRALVLTAVIVPLAVY